MARYAGSMKVVAEHVGHVPSVGEYKKVSLELRGAGKGDETFARLYKQFRS